MQRYVISFQEPYLWDTPVSFSVSGSYFTRIYENWNESRVGGRFGLGYAFTPDLIGNFGFRVEKLNCFFFEVNPYGCFAQKLIVIFMSHSETPPSWDFHKYARQHRSVRSLIFMSHLRSGRRIAESLVNGLPRSRGEPQLLIFNPITEG